MSCLTKWIGEIITFEVQNSKLTGIVVSDDSIVTELGTEFRLSQYLTEHKIKESDCKIGKATCTFTTHTLLKGVFTCLVEYNNKMEQLKELQAEAEKLTEVMQSNFVKLAEYNKDKAVFEAGYEQISEYIQGFKKSNMTVTTDMTRAGDAYLISIACSIVEGTHKKYKFIQTDGTGYTLDNSASDYVEFLQKYGDNAVLQYAKRIKESKTLKVRITEGAGVKGTEGRVCPEYSVYVDIYMGAIGDIDKCLQAR